MNYSYVLDSNGKVLASISLPNVQGYVSGNEYPDGVPCGDYIIGGKQYTPPNGYSLPPTIASDGAATWADDAIAKNAQIDAQRKSAYTVESDPLYLAAQYDGTPESLAAWRARVAEIKAKFPKV